MAATHKKLSWRQLQIDFCCIHSKLYCFSFSMGGRAGRSLPMSWTTFYTYCDDGERGKRTAGSMEIPLGVRILLWKIKGNIDVRML